MKIENLFRKYESPAGGLEALRERLALKPSPGLQPIWILAATLVLGFSAGIYGLMQRQSFPECAQCGEILSQYQNTISSQAVGKRDTVTLKVPSRSKKVSFYWVSTADVQLKR